MTGLLKNGVPVRSRIHIKQKFMNDLSRESGERLRTMIAHAISRGKSIEIDFEDLLIENSDFLDEGIAKLYSRFAKKRITSYVRLIGMVPQNCHTLKDLIEERATSFEA